MNLHWNPFFALLLFCQTPFCFAIDIVKINEKDALFTAFDQTVPIVTSSYVGWSSGWKWAGATIKTQHQIDKVSGKFKNSVFTAQIKKLAINFSGSASPQPHQLDWRYNWNKARNIPDAVGFGIEFNLNLHSPSFLARQTTPILLPDKKGWRWITPNGQSITVTFLPALADIHFERGKKNKIRAMFFNEINVGHQQTTMTVKVSKQAQINGPEMLNYDPIVLKNWKKDILPSISSPVDLSFLNLNDLPAGKHGFIKRVKDKLYFADGTPAKFWGANIMAYALFTTSDAAIALHAKRMAQLGINLIRIHHHDSNWVKPNIFKTPEASTLELSDTALKKLDWWIKCLKDNGIYVWMDLHVGRNVTRNDHIDHFDELAKGKDRVEFKGFNYYNDSVKATMQAFNEAYLTHINQFTGLSYKDDPAVIAFLLTNENDLTQHFGNKFLPNKHVPLHHELFDDDVKQFSQNTGLPYNKTWLTWKMGASKIYLNNVEHRFNQSMLSHLDQLGVKSLVATTNSWGKMGIFDLPSLTDGSIIDAHSYGRAEEFNYNPRYRPGFLTWLGAAQVTGYPLSVTEWNIEPFPARDRFTAPLFTASIANLQGWDAMMLYGYSQGQLGGWQKGSNYSSYNDPAMMGLMPAAALLYRQNHVAVANKTYELKLDSQDFFYHRYDPRSSKTIRTLLETSRITIAMPDTPELPWLANNKVVDNQAIPVTDANIDFIPPGQNFVESDTGELRRDWVKGIQTINTAKSQIASGWIGGENIQLNDVRFNITTKKALVAVQSLENKPIVDSTKLFITVMARSEPANLKNNHLPFLSEPVQGAIYISAPKGLRLCPVNNQGQFDAPLTLNYIDGQYEINLSLQNSFYWAVLREQCR